MKKFILNLSFFAVYVFVMQVILPVYVDPFNVFHYENIRNIATTPNENYIKMKHILSNPEKFTGYMFGSSRVGVIHTEIIPNEKVYNMTYTLGVPSEHLANLKTMLKNNIHPSVIYMGLDGSSYTENPERHYTQPLRCPYEYLEGNYEHFLSLYLNPSNTLRALRIILVNPHKEYPTAFNNRFYNYGWTSNYNANSNFDGNEKYFKVYNDKAFDLNAINRTISEIKTMLELCNENGIRIIIFTNPLYRVTYMRHLDRDYFTFFDELSKITDFYNFSGINDITLNHKNYLDVGHYKAEIGDMILNVICSNEIYPELYAQGFGVKVTRDNAKEFISMLRKQAEEYIK